MKKIFILALLLMFTCVAISFADETETSLFPIIADTDQYTDNQQDDRQPKHLAIYEYYNTPGSQGNVPNIERDFQGCDCSVRDQGPVDLKPAVKVSPF